MIATESRRVAAAEELEAFGGRPVEVAEAPGGGAMAVLGGEDHHPISASRANAPGAGGPSRSASVIRAAQASGVRREVSSSRS